MDADKEGFLRNERSLVQTIGRAARNEKGMVIMYADKITGSMRQAIDETNRRRSIQRAYNEEHGIIPTTIKKDKKAILEQTGVADKKRGSQKYYIEEEQPVAADPVVAYMNKDQLKKLVEQTRKNMEKAARDLDFMEAARFRDEMLELEKMIKKK
jgi:excinuclease ABC subunit B